jgi:quercetin dioxygenase-like cupin family protein
MHSFSTEARFTLRAWSHQMSKKAVFAVLLVAVTSSSTTSSLMEMRLTPAEVRATPFNGSQVGSSGVAGVRSKVLFGDPAKSGFYSILLFVPAHNTIQAHSHRDDRMATVVSGEWNFGYGDRFDEKSLKFLPPGSVYSEPGRVNHFARTGDDAAIVHVSGYGPSDTRYFDPIDDPAAQEKK